MSTEVRNGVISGKAQPEQMCSTSPLEADVPGDRLRRAFAGAAGGGRCGRPGSVRRQANQVSHEHVRAHGNKSGYADGEQGPKNMNLLGAEVEAVHLFRSRSASICYLLVARASAAVLF